MLSVSKTILSSLTYGSDWFWLADKQSSIWICEIVTRECSRLILPEDPTIVIWQSDCFLGLSHDDIKDRDLTHFCARKQGKLLKYGVGIVIVKFILKVLCHNITPI